MIFIILVISVVAGYLISIPVRRALINFGII